MKRNQSRKALLASTALVILALSPSISLAAGTVTVNGANVAITSDPASSPSINYQSDHTAAVDAGVNITGSVTTNASNTGTLILSGSSIVYGDIGTSSKALKIINAGANNTTTTFTGIVNGRTNMTGDGTLNFEQGSNGIISFNDFDGVANIAADKNIARVQASALGQFGTLNLLGGNQTVMDRIGGTNYIKVVNTGVDNSVTDFKGFVGSRNINMVGDGTLNFYAGWDSELNFNDHDGVVNQAGGGGGYIKTTLANTGTLNITGSSGYRGVGEAGMAIKAINAASDGEVVSFNSVYANAINYNGNGRIELYDGADSAFHFAGNDGTLVIWNDASLDGTVDTTVEGTGTIEINPNATINASIGSDGMAIKAIDLITYDSNATFNNTIHAQSINMVSAWGTYGFNGDIFSNIDIMLDGATIELGDGADVTGNIDTGGEYLGTLTLLGSSTINGDIGATNPLLAVNAGADGSSSTFNGIVNAQDFNITGTGTVFVSSEVWPGVTFQNDGVLTIGLDSWVGGNIDAVSDNMGTVNVFGNFYGDIGVNHSLKLVNMDAAGASVAVFGTLRTQTLNLNNGDYLLLLNTGGNMNLGSDGTLGIDGYDIAGNLTTSTANTGTLRLEGNSTVFGNIGDGNALKAINTATDGAVVTFEGAVNANSLNMSGNGTININNAASTNIEFAGHDGIINLADNKNITGSIDTTSADTGTFNVLGTSTISGIIGGTQDLKAVNAGANGEIVTFSNAVNAQSVNITGTGTVNLAGNTSGAISFGAHDGILTLADGKNLTGTVDSANANTGTFNVLGTSTISGTLGGTQALKTVNGGSAGKAVTFSQLVNTQNLNAGSGTINLNGGLTGNANFTGDGIINLADNQNITGAVSTLTDNTGTLNILGTSTITGLVGNVHALKMVSAGANGETVTFNNFLNTQTLNILGSGNIIMSGGSNTQAITFGGTGALAINYDITTDISFLGNDGTTVLADGTDVNGKIDTTIANTGTLTMLGTSVINGAIGSTQALRTVNAGADGATDSFNGTVNAQNINVTGTGTLAFNNNVTGNLNYGSHDGVITLGNNANVHGAIDASAANIGTLNLLGSSIIGNAVGGTQALKAINAGSNGATDTFNSAVNAQNIKITGTGILVFNGNVTSEAIRFGGNNGVVTLGDNSNITGPIDTNIAGTGTINMLGTSKISNAIGSTQALKTVNAGADGKTVTFNGNVNAQDINLSGNGTLAFNNSITGNANFTGHDGLIILGNGADITGAVDTSAANTGTFTVAGTSDISGTIGGTQALKTVNAGEANNVATFAGIINANQLNTGSGTVNLNGGLIGNALFIGDGVINLADNQNVTGAVDSLTANTGTLNLLGTSTISGLIGGTHALKQVSAGADGETVTFQSLVNAETFNILGNGIIRMDGGSTTGAITFANSGTLTVDISGADDYTNVISGSGKLVKDGTGILTLSGLNTYSGGTTINDGTIIGNTSSIVGDYSLNGGSLTFDQSVNGAYAGKMGGSGSFEKTGTGSVSLTGNGSGFSGLADIINGRLAFNGDYSNTSANVASGATIGGTGNVGNVEIASGGHFAPGNSIGTLNTGDVIFNNGSNYDVEINDAGQSDLINSSGTVTINGGSVNVDGAAGNYSLNTKYTIINAANSVTGTFTNVTDNLAFADPSLKYNGNNVQLEMNRNDVDFSTVGNSPALGAAIQALGAGNPIYDAYVAYTAQQAQNAQNALNNNNNNSGIVQSISLVESTVNSRLDTLSHSGDAGNLAALAPAAGGNEALKPVVHSKRLWSELIGSLGHSDADSSAGTNKQSRHSYGMLAGVDTDFSEGGYYGIFGGYEKGKTNSPGTNSDLDNFHIGAYATHPVGNGFNISGGWSGTYHDISTDRNVVIAGLEYDPQGSLSAYSTNAFATIKKSIDFDSFAVEPFAGVSLNYTYTDSYNETGGGAANLAVDSSHTINPGTVVGMRVGKAVSGFNLNATGGWQHTFGNLNNDVSQRFVGGTTDFSANGIPRDRDAAIVGLGLDSTVSDGMKIYSGYNGTLSKNASDHSIKFGLKWDF